MSGYMMELYSENAPRIDKIMETVIYDIMVCESYTEAILEEADMKMKRMIRADTDRKMFVRAVEEIIRRSQS